MPAHTYSAGGGPSGPQRCGRRSGPAPGSSRGAQACSWGALRVSDPGFPRRATPLLPETQFLVSSTMAKVTPNCVVEQCFHLKNKKKIFLENKFYYGSRKTYFRSILKTLCLISFFQLKVICSESIFGKGSRVVFNLTQSEDK